MSGLVTVDRLALRGFAGLPDSLVVSLPAGIGIVCGPNERGKSSLVAGLAAVLFGLPASNDPREFGVARYRCWDGAARFEGTLEVTVHLPAGDERWRVTRDFDSHRVRVSRIVGSALEMEHDGTHNPGARRRNERYEAWLSGLLGFHSREVFMRTFCVAQPLPAEGAIDDAVAQLLSGAAGCKTALETLADDLKARTCRSGDLGVTPRNGRNEGSLERLRRDVSALREQLSAERGAADAREATAAELTGVEAALREAGAECEGLQARREAWTTWRQLADGWRDAARQRTELQRACDEAQQAQARVREAAGDEASVRDGVLDVAATAGGGVDVAAARRALDAYSLFETADGPTIERLRHLEADRARLHARVDELEAETARAAAERDAWKREEARLGGAEEALRAVGEALDRRIAVAEARSVTEERLREERPRAARRSAVVGAGCLLLLAGVVAILLATRQVAAASAAGGVGALSLGVMLWALGASVRTLASESARLADTLGGLGAETDLQRLLDGRRQREQLAQARAVLASRRQADGPRDRGADIEATLLELDALEAMVAPFVAVWSDPAAAEARWHDARAACMAAEDESRRAAAGRLEQAGARVRNAEDALATLLAAFGQGTTVEGLRERRDLAGDRVAAAYHRLESLCHGRPELPPPQEALERACGLRELEALAHELEGAVRRRDALAEKRRQLERDLDRLADRGRLNIASAELDLAEMGAEEARLSAEVEAIAVAHVHLQAATADYQASHRERLVRAATRVFGPLAGDARRKVWIDERFGIRVRLADGRDVLPEQLSRGTQDQLYIALRLAIADLLSDRRLPLVLDDPFVTFDAGRRANVGRVLKAAAGERQVIVLTHDERLLEWGEAVALHEAPGMDPVDAERR